MGFERCLCLGLLVVVWVGFNDCGGFERFYIVGFGYFFMWGFLGFWGGGL